MRLILQIWRYAELNLVPGINNHYLVFKECDNRDNVDDITMTSKWARWRLKSSASRLFTQPFIQAQIKENIKAPRHWRFPGEFTGDRWIPHTKASNAENVSIWWRHHEERCNLHKCFVGNWRHCCVPNCCILSHTATRKCHFGEIFITGCTESCHFDNFWGSQRWQFYRNDTSSVYIYAYLDKYNAIK